MTNALHCRRQESKARVTQSLKHRLANWVVRGSAVHWIPQNLRVTEPYNHSSTSVSHLQLATISTTSCSRYCDKCWCGLYKERHNGTTGLYKERHNGTTGLYKERHNGTTGLYKERHNGTTGYKRIWILLMAKRPVKILDKFQILIVNRYSEPTIYTDAKIFQAIS